MKQNRGLSLLEVVIGLSLLGGAVLVAMGLFPTAYSSLVQARETSVATQFARGLLDRCRSHAFHSLQSIPETPMTVKATVDGQAVQTEMLYKLDLITPPPSLASQKNLYCEATVTVSWSTQQLSATPKPHKIEMTTVILNR